MYGYVFSVCLSLLLQFNINFEEIIYERPTFVIYIPYQQ
jgi:hypothetical protein